MQTQIDPETPHTFTLSTREETQEVLGRSKAVQAAKKMSDRGPRVMVQRDDERVSMTFEDGSLVQFVYETRDRVKRKKAPASEE